jgi:hypothetical protein
MKTFWGSGSIAPRTLDLGTRWRWVVSFTPRPLYPPGKSSWYPLDRRLGGPQSRSGHGGKDKNSQPLRESNRWTPIAQPVARRYTDRAITALINICYSHLFSIIFITLIILHSVFFYRSQEIHFSRSQSFFLTARHAMRTYWGSGGTAPRILDLGTRWRWVISLNPLPLYLQRKNP